MITARVFTCAIPARFWQNCKPKSPALEMLPGLLGEAHACERRLAKRVNEQNERKTSEQTLSSIEDIVRRWALRIDSVDQIDAAFEQERFPAIASGEEYLRFLGALRQRKHTDESPLLALLTRSVVRPEIFEKYLPAFESEAAGGAGCMPRLEFLRDLATRPGCGFVEFMELDHGPEGMQLAVLRPAKFPRLPQEPRSEFAGSASGESPFRLHVKSSLASGEAVNMNNANHVEITKALATFLAPDNSSATSIRVAYADGSEARPFPLRCLANAPVRDEVELRISLMSMRHLLLDSEVTFNWLRNREIDQSSTLANSDEYCYGVSHRQLEELRAIHANGPRLLIKLYHTGFEPAVVAFYRAFVESRIAGADWARVLPQFFEEGGSFQEGPSWPPLDEEGR